MTKGHLIVVANRLPVRRKDRGKDPQWSLSPGGLVSALTPILKSRQGSWIGWWGKTGPAPKPFCHDGIHNIPITISRAELDQFYYGFSNGTLWPLYHDAIRWPEYHREWWMAYVQLNQRFAEAAASTARPGDSVWVHDYHLQLVPSMLRELRSDVRIGFFLHIPFPPQELFSQIPWRRQILEGLLGSDTVGFQTRIGAQNFRQLARRFTSATGPGEVLRFDGRAILSRPFPISIDTPGFAELAASPSVQARAAEIREKLGMSRKIILGVDRLDYTKGIDIRLKAFNELLRGGEASANDCVFVQVAVPSREGLVKYDQLKRSVEELVGHINGGYSHLGKVAVHYLHRNLSQEELVSLYVAGDVMLVTPLRDGMNLVAKEYVASRLNNDGVLVLSEFTGAAKQLRSALLVNPHDVEGLKNTLLRALNLTQTESTRRMRALRAVVSRQDVFGWADSFLSALEPQR